MTLGARKPLGRRRGGENHPKVRAARRASDRDTRRSHRRRQTSSGVLALRRSLGKAHPRVVGVDDGAFDRNERTAPIAAVSLSLPEHVEAVRTAQVRVDGMDGTRRVVVLGTKPGVPRRRPRRSARRGGCRRVQRPRHGCAAPGTPVADRRGHAAAAGVRSDPRRVEEMVPPDRSGSMVAPTRAPIVPGLDGRASDPGGCRRLLARGCGSPGPAIDGPRLLARASPPRPPRRFRRPPSRSSPSEGLSRAESVGLPGL